MAKRPDIKAFNLNTQGLRLGESLTHLEKEESDSWSERGSKLDLSLDTFLLSLKCSRTSDEHTADQVSRAQNYDAPYEDASVLVLTAKSGKFVDVRFPAGAGSDSTGEQQPLSSYKNFWAFSGLSETTFYIPTPGQNTRRDAAPLPYTAHTVFTHDIDTKGPGIVDEGDMFLLPNGDCMEVGVWTNPLTGKYEMYKEYWTSPEPRHTTNHTSVTETSSLVLKKTPCVVAETVKSSGGRGIVIRIGDFCQGMYERSTAGASGNIIVVRKEKVPGSTQDPDGTNWLSDPRSDQAHNMLPIDWLLSESNPVRLGDSIVTDDGDQWRITEAEY